jgi:hypothetical protein
MNERSAVSQDRFMQIDCMKLYLAADHLSINATLCRKARRTNPPI